MMDGGGDVLVVAADPEPKEAKPESGVDDESEESGVPIEGECTLSSSSNRTGGALTDVGREGISVSGDGSSVAV
jgi:hypothetical protein